MCLSTIMPKNKQDVIRNKIGEEGLRVYKVVKVIETDNQVGYFPPYQYTVKQDEYDPGDNRALGVITLYLGRHSSYVAGFHFFKTKKAAEGFKVLLEKARYSEEFKVIPCIVKKEWITEIGTEESHIFDSSRVTHKIVVVARRAIFPQFRKEIK